MSEEMQRRLAAIISADVVGYSRLMGTDEAGTLERLRAHRRELIDPKIAEHGGRIVKTMGDGLLLEFPSVVNATQCALEIQEGMKARNVDVPDDKRIIFRIGVNLGDIIIEGEDILGDGVNVAARLQEIAEPGGVAISRRVHEDVQDRLDASFEDAGEQVLKNIARPVQVWRWLPAERGVPTTPESGTVSLPLPDKPSIAVLSFNNMSGDPEQEYFADGIAEDIITGVSCVRSFFVIARNSSFTYKGQSVDVSDIARELGVRYILEGSVRRAGKRIRVTAQLIDAPSRNHVWAERFDRNLDDIFQVQDEITGAIVAAMGPEVDSAERERALRRSTERLDVWSAYQRGLWHIYRFTQVDTETAGGFLGRAIDLDPTFAPAYAGLSLVYYLKAFLGYAEDREGAIAEAYALARQSVVLDGKDPMAHWALGRVHKLRGEHDLAIAAFKAAIEINPSYAHAHYGLGWALVLAGEPERAIECLDQALRLSPRDPLLFAFMIVRAQAHLLIGEDEEALNWAEKAARQINAHVHTKAVYAAVLQRRGRPEAAGRVIENILMERPEYCCDLFKRSFAFKRPQDLNILIDAMRSAGLPE